jgi:hypothetical protein
MNKLLALTFIVGLSISCNAQVKKMSEKQQCNRVFDSSLKKWIYLSTTKAPEFPGGNDKMALFIAKNLKYPDQGRFKGNVSVSFIVEKDGVITNGHIQDNYNEDEIDREVLRVISLMPKWIPGECHRIKVPAKVSLPINF